MFLLTILNFLGTDEAITVKYVYSVVQGEQYILVSGYSFQRLRTYSTRTTTWACSTHYKEGCKARVHTSGHRVLYRKFGHHHNPSKNWTEEKPLNRSYNKYLSNDNDFETQTQ